MGFISFLEEHLLSCRWENGEVGCIGCGIQRSIVHILKGEFTEAFYIYPAIYTLLIMLVYLGLHYKFNFTNGDKVILWMFVLNLAIILINYTLKVL